MAQSVLAQIWDEWRHARVRARRSSYPADWYIEDEESVGQDPDHQEDEFHLQSRLLAWKDRTNQGHLLVGCELTCRWDPVRPKVGVDPDVYVVTRPFTNDPKGYIGSLKTWKDGNSPPLLAIEIVSKSRPLKDYRDSPEKHDLLGTFELWIFDPHLYGYAGHQPPVLLQVFQRETNNSLAMKDAGNGPFRSDALDAWVTVIDGDIVISNDRDGKDRWPTLEEAERRRTEEQTQRADEEARRADEEARRADEEARRADEEARRADEERAAKEQAMKRAEEERAAKEQAMKQAEEERAAKEQAMKQAEEETLRAKEAFSRIAELEALLAKRA